MSLDQMHGVTKGELARLHPLTKKEFRAWVNNKVTPILGYAEMVSEAWRNDIDGEAGLAIARAARQFLSELEALLGEKP